MKRRTLLLSLSALILVAVVVLYGYRWLQVDRCLDNGGAWNYELRRCEGART